MAQKSAPLAGYAIEDLHSDLGPSRVRGERLEAPVEREAPSDGTMLDGFASLRPSKRGRLVPYPIRLPQSQIDSLERLRAERGIIPSEFIRDAVAGCLRLVGGDV
jgi:hypothetical protein